jgi:hypothetical protein
MTLRFWFDARDIAVSIHTADNADSNWLRKSTLGRRLNAYNIWIILGTLLALLAITRYSLQERETQRICADDPSASVCER